MLLLLFGMLALVFVTTWALLRSLLWAVVLAVVTLVGGAVFGMSTDRDDVDA